MSLFSIVDDKYIPLFRVMWVAAVPHFCGEPDCQHEGDYEIALEQGESVWANRQERDEMLKALENWYNHAPPEGDDDRPDDFPSDPDGDSEPEA